jgi:hypothetical protein
MHNPQKTRTARGIAESVRLFLHSDRGENRVCILVEGSDDAKIYPHFFKNVQTQIMVIKSNGKSKMKETLKILFNTKIKQVIGICDADFAHLENLEPEYANMFLTDCHDIEMTMLWFHDVLCNTLSKYSVQRMPGKIMDTILQETAYMAYVRWYNQKHQCNINFRTLDFATIFDVHDWNIEQDKNEFLNILNRLSNKKTKVLTNEEINDFIRENQTNDRFNLCNGHDVTKLIALLLSNIKKCSVSPEDYCNVLRESFQLTHFMQTKLYANILAWQQANHFDLLKTDYGVANV